MAPPFQDPAIVSSQRPNAVYTRAQLLSLYASPLVPDKLEGMKELAEWHGEFADPPSPPVPQRLGLPSRPSERSERGTPRRLPADSSNASPFANFGRFGVDGGLGDGSLEGPGAATARRRGARGADREVDKDVAPHLRGAAAGASSGAAGSGEPGPGSPTKERGGFALANERERGERGERTKGRGGVAAEGGLARGGERELRRRDEAELAAGLSKRDMRRGVGPADEGGWRNVGMSREEREKRLIRNQLSPSNSNTLEPNRRERGERSDRGDRDRDGPSSRSGRPAWMDDGSPSGSTGGASPAWMDAPASGNLSFDGTGHVRDGEDKAPLREELTMPSLASFSGGAGGKNGLDGLQAFKAQMKERERKDREREMRAAGIPVEHESAPAPATESSPALEPAKSIFEDLGISRATQPPPGLGGPAVGEGGRSSRFARFFDGKPTTQAAQQQPQASAFSSLLAGMGGPEAPAGDGAGPSKEDSDSMARLLGMLQVSGAKTASPLFGGSSPAAPQQAMSPSSLSSQVPSADASPAPTMSSARTADEGRASSRFTFSNRSTVASPATPAAPAAPGLQSPFLSAPAPPPGFGLPSPQSQNAASPANTRSPPPPPPQARPLQPNGDAHHGGSNGVSPPPHQAQFSPQGPPPPGMPPQFYGQRFPPPLPGQLPPGMPPPFAFGPDGRPLPPPPPPHPGMLPPFASPTLLRANGPLSPPPLASPNGASVSPGAQRPPFFPHGAPLPPQLMYGPGPGVMSPPPGGMPFPPPPPLHHLQGRMPPPPPMFTAGNNPGADLMALLNSGAAGQRIGADGPPQGVQVRPM
ncbi:hypothetical protein JCM3770_005958 [Rhodotorula araucariae]